MNKRKMKINFYDQEYEVIPTFATYQVTDFMGKKLHIPALRLYFESDEGLQSFGVLTKSFGEFIGIKNAAYIDTNNNPFAEKMLSEYGIAKPTGWSKASGFCRYPLWQFDESFLREIGGAHYQAYSDEFDSYMSGDEAPTLRQIL